MKMRTFVLCFALNGPLGAAGDDLRAARDRQDRAALEKMIADFAAAASKQKDDPAAEHRVALAESYLAEVATEMKDKLAAKNAAESGIQAAQKAVALKPDVAEYHRVLGTLCGQVIPAGGVLSGMKWGKCAMDEVNKAVSLDPHSSDAYLSRGVGNYYLPPSFGGGPELSVKDFEKAIELNPKSAEAHMWLGIAMRKLNRNTEAHQELEKAVALNPNRIWAKQQLEKTPAN
jgi:tetratricopeptide (TPR) repeat protein